MNWKLSGPVVAALLALTALAAGRQEETPEEAPRPKPPEMAESPAKNVHVVPIVGVIDYTQNAFVRRAAREAKAARANLVIFEIDSPGGEIGAMMQIGVHILSLADSGIETVAFVRPMGEEGVGGNAYSAAAYIAMCSKKIYMYPTAVMGAAAPVTFGPEGMQELGEKIVSATREKFRAIAERNGYPPNLAAAMVDKEIEVLKVKIDGKMEYPTPEELQEAKNRGAEVGEVRTVCASGKLLTLTQTQAIEHGMAKEASSRQDIYTDMGVVAKVEVLSSFSWSESLVAFLMSPVVATLFLIVGVLGIWIELKTPGFGVPGIVGVVAFVFLLFGHHLAGLAEMTEILLFFAGIALVAVEIFLLPGTGVFAILGVICIFGGLVLSFQPFVIPSSDSPWESDLFLSSIGRVLISFVASSVGFIVLVRYMSRVPGLNRYILQAELAAEGGSVAPSQPVSGTLVGKTGIAVTPLRPGGKVEIGGTVYDVVAQGDYVAKDDPVTVTALDGARILVERAQKD